MKNDLYVFTFQDFLDLASGVQNTAYYYYDKSYGPTFFTSAYTSLGGVNPTASITGLNTNTMFKNLFGLIVLKYFDRPIIYGEDSVLSKPLALQFYNKLIAFYYHSKDKYETLLKAYATKQSDIEATVGAKATTVSKFNEVPQDVNTDLVGDSYLTNASRNETETKLTPVEELERIRQLYTDVLDDWALEFHNRLVLPIHGL